MAQLLDINDYTKRGLKNKMITGIIVGVALILFFIINSSLQDDPNLKDSKNQPSEDFTNELPKSEQPANQQTPIKNNPVKIEDFLARQQDDNIILSVIVDGKIPFYGKNLPISETADAFGYAWLMLEKGDHLHHQPDRYSGFMATIKPGDDGTSPQKWWTVHQVNIVQMDPDVFELCLLSPNQIQTNISVDENQLKVEMITDKRFEFASYHAMPIELINDQDCLSGKSVNVLD